MPNIKQAIRQLDKPDQKDRRTQLKENELLQELISAAYQLYVKQNKNKRSMAYTEIGSILAQYSDENGAILNADEKVKRVKAYLVSSKFTRGYYGNSYFADCMHAALYLYSCEVNARKVQQIVSDRSSKAYKAYYRDVVTRAYHAHLSRNKGVVEKEDKDYFEAVIDQEWDGTEPFSPPSKEFAKLIEKAKGNFRSYEGVTVKEEDTRRTYRLADYYLFAIERYRNEVYGLSKERKDTISELIKIIKANAGDTDELKSKVKQFFKTNPEYRASITFSSRLEKYFDEALKDFNSKKLVKDGLGHRRHLVTRTWQPSESVGLPVGQVVPPHQLNKQHESLEASNSTVATFAEPADAVVAPPVTPPKEKRVVVLAIHGLGDSVETWEALAPELARRGAEVIAYNQAGHDTDELRGKPLDLRQMQDDLYYQIRKLHEEGVDEIHLVAHSLGGALLANSMGTVDKPYFESLDADKKPIANKIKSVTCLSPAVMTDAFLEGISNIGVLSSKDPGNMGYEVKSIRDQGLARTGGGLPAFISSPKKYLQSVFQFLSFVGDAFVNLRKLARGEYKLMKEVKRDTAQDTDPKDKPVEPVKKQVFDRPWLVLQSVKDKLVHVSNSNALAFAEKQAKAEPGGQSRVTVEKIEDATHHAHAIGSRTESVVSERVCNFIIENSEILKAKNTSALVHSGK